MAIESAAVHWDQDASHQGALRDVMLTRPVCQDMQPSTRWIRVGALLTGLVLTVVVLLSSESRSNNVDTLLNGGQAAESTGFISVVVPPGVKGGQMFTVQVPGHGMINVRAPLTDTAGQRFQASLGSVSTVSMSLRTPGEPHLLPAARLQELSPVAGSAVAGTVAPEVVEGKLVPSPSALNPSSLTPTFLSATAVPEAIPNAYTEPLVIAQAVPATEFAVPQRAPLQQPTSYSSPPPALYQQQSTIQQLQQPPPQQQQPAAPQRTPTLAVQHPQAPPPQHPQAPAAQYPPAQNYQLPPVAARAYAPTYHPPAARLQNNGQPQQFATPQAPPQNYVPPPQVAAQQPQNYGPPPQVAAQPQASPQSYGPPQAAAPQMPPQNQGQEGLGHRDAADAYNYGMPAEPAEVPPKYVGEVQTAPTSFTSKYQVVVYAPLPPKGRRERGIATTWNSVDQAWEVDSSKVRKWDEFKWLKEKGEWEKIDSYEGRPVPEHFEVAGDAAST